MLDNERQDQPAQSSIDRARARLAAQSAGGGGSAIDRARAKLAASPQVQAPIQNNVADQVGDLGQDYRDPAGFVPPGTPIRVMGMPGQRPMGYTAQELAQQAAERHKPYDYFGGDIMLGLERGVGQVERQVGGAMATAGNFLPGQLGRGLVKAGTDRGGIYAPQLQQLPQTDSFLGGVAESVPGLTAAIGTGVMTAGAGPMLAIGAGALTSGMQTGGGQFADAYDRLSGPGVSKDQAVNAAASQALIAGAVSAVTSVVPMGQYLGKIAPNSVNAFTSKMLGNSVTARLFAAAFTEGSQEAVEQVGQMFAQYIAEDDPAAFKDWQRQIGMAAAGGALLGPVGEGMARFLTRGTNAAQGPAVPPGTTPPIAPATQPQNPAPIPSAAVKPPQAPPVTREPSEWDAVDQEALQRMQEQLQPTRKAKPPKKPTFVGDEYGDGGAGARDVPLNGQDVQVEGSVGQVAPASNQTQTAASVPTMITRGMEEALFTLGYTGDDVYKMTPAQAWEILKGNVKSPVTPSAGRGAETQGGGKPADQAAQQQPARDQQVNNQDDGVGVAGQLPNRTQTLAEDGAAFVERARREEEAADAVGSQDEPTLPAVTSDIGGGPSSASQTPEGPDAQTYPWLTLAQNVVSGQIPNSKAKKIAASKGYYARFAEAKRQIQETGKVDVESLLSSRFDPVGSKQGSKTDYAQEREQLQKEKVQNFQAARDAITNRPGWKIESESKSGSLYAVHEASGKIIRLSDHEVPDHTGGERAKSQPWVRDIYGKLGPNLAELQEAFVSVEEDAASEEEELQELRRRATGSNKPAPSPESAGVSTREQPGERGGEANPSLSGSLGALQGAPNAESQGSSTAASSTQAVAGTSPRNSESQGAPGQSPQTSRASSGATQDRAPAAAASRPDTALQSPAQSSAERATQARQVDEGASGESGTAGTALPLREANPSTSKPRVASSDQGSAAEDSQGQGAVSSPDDKPWTHTVDTDKGPIRVRILADRANGNVLAEWDTPGGDGRPTSRKLAKRDQLKAIESTKPATSGVVNVTDLAVNEFKRRVGESTSAPTEKEPWEMTPSEWRDWSYTEDYRNRLESAEAEEKAAEKAAVELENEIGQSKFSVLGAVKSVDGISPQSFALMQLVDGIRQQEAFNKALSEMPAAFREKHANAIARYELAHAKVRSFDDLNTAKEQVSEYPDLAKKDSGKKTTLKAAQQTDPSTPAPVAAEDSTSAPAKTGAQSSERAGEEGTDPVSKLVAKFAAGDSFRTIVEARKALSEITGKPIKPGTNEAKEADETIEAAIVKAAQKIVRDGRAANQTPVEIYRRLVKLYEQQPRLGVRTGKSMLLQAYSTPMPLAYISSELAGIGPGVTVYEPTAGNGALLIGADPATTKANELDPKRAEALRNAGFDATAKDATTTGPADKSIDAVIENPPFGVLTDSKGMEQRWPMGKGQTKYIDQAIAAKSLAAMKDDGSAVLILGGVQDRTGKGTREAGYNNAKRPFYFWLYNNFNVADHFTVDGKLYERQGAGFPVDVIVIRGRGKSALELPARKAPRVYDSWSALEGVLPNEQTQYKPLNNPPAPDQGTGGTGRDSGPRGSGNLDRTSVSNPASEQGEGSSEQGGTATGTDAAPAGGRKRKPVSESGGRGAQSDRVAGTGDRGGSGQQETGGSSRVEVPDSSNTDQGPRGTQEVSGSDARGVAEPTPSPAVESTEETEHQAAYKPESDGFSLGTLMPRNQVAAVRHALETVREERGELTTFVASELGWTPESTRTRLAAEQIDAVAMAIHQAKNGAGFVLGDQTGIGKGRVVATLLTWAQRQGHVPVFLTQDPKLYGDMLRDFEDIGNPSASLLPTNSDLAGAKAIKSPSGNVVQSVPQALKAIETMADNIGETGELKHNGRKYAAIATTYAQLQGAASNERRATLKRIAGRAFFVLDESHNAGGQVLDDRAKAWMEKEGKVPRAQFIRELLAEAQGVVYSSATWAKRPDVMDLYHRTDLQYGVDDPKQLGEAIRRGGVAMQQVVSSALSRLGQYVRRERAYKGVDFKTEAVPVPRATVESVTESYRAIAFFEEQRKDAVEQITKNLQGEGEVAKDGSTGSAGVESTNFTSQLHNAISQMNLSAKVESAVQAVAKNVADGQKVVIALENTMEALISRQREDEGARIGDPADISFKKRLMQYLKRSRQIRIVLEGEDGKKTSEVHYLTDEDLGPAATKSWETARKMIEEIEDSALPVSPIDYLMYRLREKGIRVGELTGRDERLDYSSRTQATYANRPGLERSQKGQQQTIAGFQNGELDVVILNASGATGISLHADKKRAKDQRQRHMLILQPIRNIDTFMQALGRVHRTGQVVLPRYTLLVGDIPSEKRPAAVLRKKMASLNANVSSARSGAVDFDAPDLMNEVGDMVISEWIDSGPPEVAMMFPGDQSPEPSDSDPGKLAERVTGRAAMLPLGDQERLWKQWGESFNEKMEYLNSTGQNPLELRVKDAKARTLSVQPYLPERAGPTSFFTSPSNIERVEMKAEVPPLSLKQIAERAAAGYRITATEPAALEEAHDELVQKMVAAAKEREAEVLSRIKDPEARIKRERSLNELRGQWRNAMSMFEPLAVVEHPQFGIGISMGVRFKEATENPLAASSWKAEVAFPDDRTAVGVPFGDVYKLGAVREFEWSREYDAGRIQLAKEEQADAAANPISRRFVVTGNTLQALPRIDQDFKAKGAVMAMFTREDGSTDTGIILPRNISEEQVAAAVRNSPKPIEKAEHAARLLRLSKASKLMSDDGVLEIVKNPYSEYEVRLPAERRRAARYLSITAATDAAGKDFVKRQGRTVLEVSEENLGEVVKAYVDAGIKLSLATDRMRLRSSASATKAELEADEQRFEEMRNADIELHRRVTGLSDAPKPAPDAGIVAKLDEKIAEVQKRLDSGGQRPGQSFPGARGGFADFGTVIDAAQLIALKALRAGVKGAQAVARYVKDATFDLRVDRDNIDRETANEIEIKARELLADDPSPETVRARVTELKAKGAQTKDAAVPVKRIPRARDRMALLNAGVVAAARGLRASDTATRRKGNNTREFNQGVKKAAEELAKSTPALNGRAAEIVRVAKGLMRQARGKSKELPKKAAIETAYQEAAADLEKANQRGQQADTRGKAAAQAGVTTGGDRMVSEKEALAGKIRGQQATANKLTTEAGRAVVNAIRQTQRTQTAAAARTLRELHTSVWSLRKARDKAAKQMTKFESRSAALVAAAKEKGKRKTADGIRAEALRVIRAYVPREISGRYLEALSNTDSMAKLAGLLGRVRRDLGDYELRQQVKATEAAIKKANSAKMLEEHRELVNQARGLLAGIRATMDELYSLADKTSATDELRNAESLAKEARHRQDADEYVRVGNKIVTRERLVARGVKRLASRKQMKRVEGLSETVYAGLMGKFHAANLTPDTVGAMMLDKNLRRLISEDFWDGETQVNADRSMARDAMRKLVEKAGYKWGSDQLQRLTRSASGRSADVMKLKLPDAGTIELTPDEWMGLYATATDGEARGNIMEGTGITFTRDKRMDEIKLSPEDVEALDTLIPKNLRDIVWGAKAFIESSVRPGVFQAFREQTGYDLMAVNNYWPTHRNREQLPVEQLVNTSAKFVRVALERLGFLKERDGGKTPYLISGFFKEFHDHTYQAAVVTHMTRRVRSAENVYNDKRMRRAIELAFGEQMNGEISEIIDAAKLVTKEPSKPLEHVLTFINKNYAKAKLLLNPKTWMKQIGGMFKLLDQIDIKHWRKGIARMFSKEVDEILNGGAYFRNRYEDAIWRRVTPALNERGPLLGEPGLLEAAKRLLIGGKGGQGNVLARMLRSQVAERMGAAADLVDAITVLNWFDSLNARVAIGAKLAEAEEKGIVADNRRDWIERESEYVMRRTQNGHSVLEQSRFARRTRGNWLGQLVMFASDANKTFNLLVAAWQSGSKARFARAVAAAGLNLAWSVMVMALFKAALSQDPQKAMEAAVRATINDSVGIVYGGQEVAAAGEAILRVLQKKPAFGSGVRLFETPGVTVLEDFTNGTTKLLRSMVTEGVMTSGPNKGKLKADVYFDAGLEETGLAVSDLLGLPISPMYRMAKEAIKSGGK